MQTSIGIEMRIIYVKNLSALIRRFIHGNCYHGNFHYRQCGYIIAYSLRSRVAYKLTPRSIDLQFSPIWMRRAISLAVRCLDIADGRYDQPFSPYYRYDNATIFRYRLVFRLKMN